MFFCWKPSSLIFTLFQELIDSNNSSSIGLKYNSFFFFERERERVESSKELQRIAIATSHLRFTSTSIKFPSWPIIVTINAWQECNANTRDNTNRIDERYSLWRTFLFLCRLDRAKFTLSVLHSWTSDHRESFYSGIFILSSCINLSDSRGKELWRFFRKMNFLRKTQFGFSKYRCREKFEKAIFPDK